MRIIFRNHRSYIPNITSYVFLSTTLDKLTSVYNSFVFKINLYYNLLSEYNGFNE